MQADDVAARVPRARARVELCSVRRGMAATGWWRSHRAGVHAPFANIRWSSEFALADTLRNQRNGTAALLRKLHDVDTAADLHAPNSQNPS